MAKGKAKLLIACPETCADLFWATKFSTPDPFAYIEINGKSHILLTDLEYGRGLKEAKVDQVVSVSDLNERLRAIKSNKMNCLDLFLKDKGINTLSIPHYFPVALAESLKKKKYKLEMVDGLFFPARMQKTNEEKKFTAQSLNATENAIRLAIKTLRESRMKGRYIYHRGKRLTSEGLRATVENHLFHAGYISQHTIIAGGRQGADPHVSGHGPLIANEPIVIDIAPKSKKTGYFGDVTRTVVKGKASPKIKEIYQIVQTVQKGALKKIRAGVKGSSIYYYAIKLFEEAGYGIRNVGGQREGFITGLGHGLGLEIHEPIARRLGATGGVLKKGEIISVEPGLYYPKLGGVRIEDIVYVTKRGCEVLTRLPQFLEIR